MQDEQEPSIIVRGACEHNLKALDTKVKRNAITVITGVSGSGKSSLAFDTILSEAQRRFFYTLSHYSRQFLDIGTRPAVRSITGLSPAIGLAQNETQPSRRASVGTLTDAAELLSVLYAQFGERRCPKHGLATSSLSLKAMVEGVIEGCAGRLVAVCSPVAEHKKGQFRRKLESFAAKGFMKVYADGETLDLNPIPELAKEEKHVLKLLVDHVQVKEASLKRLERSLSTALEQGEGVVEVIPCDSKGRLMLEEMRRLSASEGCPQCHYSWPNLDARFFSANSLGRCSECRGYGIRGAGEVDDEEDEAIEADGVPPAELCLSCQGSGINPLYAHIRLGGLSVQEAQNLSIGRLSAFLRPLGERGLSTNPAFCRVRDELLTTAERICKIGLSYLSLARRIRTLSGGELQRIKLAGLLAENLRGVLYVLDEPSQGLHPRELAELQASLTRLKDMGNTILMVDHDDYLIRHADWVIDMGPGGGRDGGQILACFRPAEAKVYASQSLTARLLGERERVRLKAHAPQSEFITLRGATLHNLQVDEVRFCRAAFNVITGVSGAGKSSLVLATLYPLVHAYIMDDGVSKRIRSPHCRSLSGLDGLNGIDLINRKPIAKSTVSMPATYLDIFTEVRKLYESLPEAQILGISSRAFSLHVDGGRCEECKGRGEVLLKMKFLSDARVRCSLCSGRRYQPHVLEILYRGLSIADVLELTIDEALGHFANHRAIVKRLSPAKTLGLGYLKLGQPSASLSGGEAQRLKLAPYLGRRGGSGRSSLVPCRLLILEEPTQGLHLHDVRLLIAALGELVDQGMTLLIVEHSPEMIASADWVVDLGPGAAEAGGQLVYEGPARGLAQCKASVTGRYFKEWLRQGLDG